MIKKITDPVQPVLFCTKLCWETTPSRKSDEEKEDMMRPSGPTFVKCSTLRVDTLHNNPEIF